MLHVTSYSPTLEMCAIKQTCTAWMRTSSPPVWSCALAGCHTSPLALSFSQTAAQAPGPSACQSPQPGQGQRQQPLKPHSHKQTVAASWALAWTWEIKRENVCTCDTAEGVTQAGHVGKHKSVFLSGAKISQHLLCSHSVSVISWPNLQPSLSLCHTPLIYLFDMNQPHTSSHCRSESIPFSGGPSEARVTDPS